MHSQPASPALTPPPQKYDGPDEECEHCLYQLGLNPESVKQILDYNSIKIGLLDTYTALQILQTVVTEKLRVKDRKAIIPEDDLEDIKGGFARHTDERYAALSAKARREVMRIHGDARRLLPAEKSVYLMSYLRQNKDPVTASMEAQYQLNVEVLPYLVKTILDLESDLHEMRKIVEEKAIPSRQHRASQKKHRTSGKINERAAKTANIREFDIQSKPSPRRSARIAKRGRSLRCLR